jgi:hypothetical protein
MTVSREKEKKIQDLIPLKISQSLYPRENISIKMKIFTWWMQNLLVSSDTLDFLGFEKLISST